MGIDIQTIAKSDPRFGYLLGRLDLKGDADGQIEIPDIVGTPDQEALRQDEYRTLMHEISSVPGGGGPISGHQVVVDLVVYLSTKLGIDPDKVHQQLMENFAGKRVASSGDSMFYNVAENTGFPNGIPPHFQNGEPVTPSYPVENSTYCESLRGCLQWQLGFDPSQTNIRTVDTAFPTHLPLYIRDHRQPVLYTPEFFFKVTPPFNAWVDPQETNPGANWLDVSLPAATLTDFMTPPGSRMNSVGMLFVNALLPHGKTAPSLLHEHLMPGSTSGGGALVLHYGQNDLFTMDGFILGRPEWGNVTPEEFRGNVARIAKGFDYLGHRVIWIKPLRVDYLLEPINTPDAHFTNGDPIPPGEYFSIRPWVESVRQGAPLERRNALSRGQVEHLVLLQRHYAAAIDEAATEHLNVIPIDINDRLKGLLDKLAAGEVLKVGDCEFASRDELLTLDGIHPRPALYAKLSQFVGEELREAGVFAAPLDVDAMARKAPERYCGEKIDDATKMRMVNFNSATLGAMKNGNPSSLWNILVPDFLARGFAGVVRDAQSEYSLVGGVGVEGEIGTINIPGRRALQLSATLFRFGIDAFTAPYRFGEGTQFENKFDIYVSGGLSRLALFQSPGTYPWRLTAGWAFCGVEELVVRDRSASETFTVDGELRYGLNHAPNVGEPGWSVYLQGLTRPFNSTRDYQARGGLEYNF